jgi:hypothetical protein
MFQETEKSTQASLSIINVVNRPGRSATANRDSWQAEGSFRASLYHMLSLCETGPLESRQYNAVNLLEKFRDPSYTKCKVGRGYTTCCARATKCSFLGVFLARSPRA